MTGNAQISCGIGATCGTELEVSPVTDSLALLGDVVDHQSVPPLIVRAAIDGAHQSCVHREFPDCKRLLTIHRVPRAPPRPASHRYPRFIVFPAPLLFSSVNRSHSISFLLCSSSASSASRVPSCSALSWRCSVLVGAS